MKHDMILTVNQLQERYEDKNYTGNRYQDYDTAVKELDSKYRAKSQWGCTLTGNIIDLRAAFIIMQGLKIAKIEGEQDAEETVKWIEGFLRYNEIDGIMIYQLASEAELEGKIALWINMKEGDYPSVRFISYVNKKYKIETAPNDYLDYKQIKWKKDNESKWTKVQAPDFVYNKFGGRMYDANDAVPKTIKCLTQIEDVDRAMTDWRLINNLFAAPTLHADCEDEQQAKQLREALYGTDATGSSTNWKIKKLLITTKTNINLLSPEMGGVDSLKEEILAKIKIISGTTAIPIHYLGLLDMLKNRATGINVQEMVIAGTEREREIWKSTWREVIRKAIAKANQQEYRQKRPSKQLNPNAFRVEIPTYTQEQWANLEKVLLPLYLANGISLRYLLSQIPNVDVEAEIKEKEEKENEMFPGFKKEEIPEIPEDEKEEENAD